MSIQDTITNPQTNPQTIMDSMTTAHTQTGDPSTGDKTATKEIKRRRKHISRETENKTFFHLFVCFSKSSVALQVSQPHQTWYEPVKLNGSSYHVVLKRSCVNILRKMPAFSSLLLTELYQLSPLNIRSNLTIMFMIMHTWGTIKQNLKLTE